MAYTYTTFVAALVQSSIKQTDDPQFASLIPTFIQDAEERCYRDLDLLSTIISDATASTIPSVRNFTLPQPSQGRFVVLQTVNILQNTLRYPLTKLPRPVIDVAFPDSQALDITVMPKAYAPLTDQVIILGPSPGDAFLVECIGTIRPTPLSSDNTTTFLSSYLPDLLFSAAMVSVKVHMSQLQVPEWMPIYDSQLASANIEEIRNKYTYSVPLTPKVA